MPSLLIKSFHLYNKRRDAYYFYLYSNSYISIFGFTRVFVFISMSNP